MSEDLMEALGEEVTLESFVPRVSEPGDYILPVMIWGRSRAMIIMLLYIIIVIMAFVFGITIQQYDRGKKQA
ncbi:MAG: hypothetical protein ACLVH3_09545 [Blautia obeum]